MDYLDRHVGACVAILAAIILADFVLTYIGW